MDKSIILVTAVGGDIGSSAVRALRETTRIIIGCDMRPYPAVRDLLDSFYVVPTAADQEAYLNSLKNIAIRNEVGFILPVSEPEIALVSDQRKELESIGLKLMINNPTVLGTFLDKYLAAQYLLSLGLPTPRTTLLEKYDGSFGFPLVVKARKGHGNKKTWEIEDGEDLAYIRRKNNGLCIVQEYVGSKAEEYTTGVFSDGMNVFSITFRRQLGFGSLSAEAELVEAPYLDKVSAMISKETGLVGCINIQSRRVNDVFVIFEINPRLSSTLLFRKKFGFDDAVWWLDILQGKKNTFRKMYKSGRAVRFVSECYFDMERL